MGLYKMTWAHATWWAVNDDGETVKFVEGFSQSARATDAEVLNQALRSFGAWRRIPRGEAFRLKRLARLTRSERNRAGELVNTRTIYNANEA